MITNNALKKGQDILHPIYGRGRVKQISRDCSHLFIKFENKKAINGWYHKTMLIPANDTCSTGD
jgi:hypothetical protein